jgi:hypothetical protein
VLILALVAGVIVVVIALLAIAANALAKWLLPGDLP